MNLKKLIDEANNLGIVISEKDVKAMGEFDDKMQTVNASLETAKAKLGLELMPYFEDLANWAIENAPEIGKKNWGGI